MRIVGLVLLALGVSVLVGDLAASAGAGLRLHAFGEWWFWAHPDSLQVAQPAVQRHLVPELWDYVIQPLLEWPLALELLALAAAVLGLSWLLRRRRAARG